MRLGQEGVYISPPIITKKPMTNADRIRAMTEEELAEWLFLRDLGVVNKLIFAANIRNAIRYDKEKCVDDIVEWLKSPADKEES